MFNSMFPVAPTVAHLKGNVRAGLSTNVSGTLEVEVHSKSKCTRSQSAREVSHKILESSYFEELTTQTSLVANRIAPFSPTTLIDVKSQRRNVQCRIPRYMNHPSLLLFARYPWEIILSGQCTPPCCLLNGENSALPRLVSLRV